MSRTNRYCKTEAKGLQMTGDEAASIRHRLGLSAYQMSLVLGFANGGRVEGIERSKKLSRTRADSYRLIQIAAGLSPIGEVCRPVSQLLDLAKLKRGKGRPRKNESSQMENHA